MLPWNDDHLKPARRCSTYRFLLYFCNASSEINMKLSSYRLLAAACVSTVCAMDVQYEQTHLRAARQLEPKSACSVLAAVAKNKIFAPETDVYEYEKTQFWSNTQLLDPGCVFRPQSAEDVAAGIKALADNNASFAVRGGGHMGIPVSGDTAFSQTMLTRRSGRQQY